MNKLVEFLGQALDVSMAQPDALALNDAGADHRRRIRHHHPRGRRFDDQDGSERPFPILAVVGVRLPEAATARSPARADPLRRCGARQTCGARRERRLAHHVVTYGDPRQSSSESRARSDGWGGRGGGLDTACGGALVQRARSLRTSARRDPLRAGRHEISATRGRRSDSSSASTAAISKSSACKQRRSIGPVGRRNNGLITVTIPYSLIPELGYTYVFGLTIVAPDSESRIARPTRQSPRSRSCTARGRSTKSATSSAQRRHPTRFRGPHRRHRRRSRHIVGRRRRRHHEHHARVGHGAHA